MSKELVCYAVSESVSRGRRVPEKPHPYRCPFERDRDRIIHCSAFRRLEGKTQVFTPGIDDYYRTRLTHSIEVAQIGRTIAKALGINESLTEAICLAHDLGHPPFGHAGEQALNDLMGEFGQGDQAEGLDRIPPASGGLDGIRPDFVGFEHNHQSLRIVDLLEHPYPDFTGLNLMYETRLGLAKHQSPYDEPQDQAFSEANCSLEGQVAQIADRIAYNCHDLEDGLRAGLISSEQLRDVEIFTQAQRQVEARAIKNRAIRRTPAAGGLDPLQGNALAAKAIIDKLVSDCIEGSKKGLRLSSAECPIAKGLAPGAGVKSLDDVYARSENLIVLSEQNDAALAELEKSLLENFYQHKSLLQTAEQVKSWLGQLFEKLCEKPELMPAYFQRFIPEHGLKRTACDYIAGMTDRFTSKMLKEI